ncbi:hypothetical protein H0H93_007521 [Arthromyces matolae]|nr:hypothetical protein H0H93_007521 [Arthromyces matolae]
MHRTAVCDAFDDKLGRNVEQILFKCPNLTGLGFVSPPSYTLYRIKWDIRPLPPITHLSVTINHPNILETVERFQHNLVSLSISIDCPHDLIHRPISLPLLKTLSISVKNERYLDRIADSIQVILHGISKLQNLVYECLKESPPDHFPPRVLLYPPYGVGPHLRSLSISSDLNPDFTWRHVQTILDACPKLEHLAMNPTPSTLPHTYHPKLKSLDLGTPFDYTQFMLGRDVRKYQDLPYFPSLQRRRKITLRTSETRFFLPISLSFPLEQIHSDFDAFRMDFQQVRLRHSRGHVCIAGKALGLYPVPQNPAVDQALWDTIVAIVTLVLIGTLTAWGALLLLKLLK